MYDGVLKSSRHTGESLYGYRWYDHMEVGGRVAPGAATEKNAPAISAFPPSMVVVFCERRMK